MKMRGARWTINPDQAVQSLVTNAIQEEEERLTHELLRKLPFIHRSRAREKALPWRKRLILRYRRWQRAQRLDAKL